jgi:hypothetical protein
MALRTNADFLFGPTKCKVIPLNADLSTPLPKIAGSLTTLESVGGSPGETFDFSGVSDISDVEFKVKVNATEDAVTSIDLSAAVSQSAVTAAEIVTAFTAAGYTGVTLSVDSRGYLVLDVTTPGTDQYVQVYGEGAEIANFGQGYGSQFITIDTQQSNSKSPTLKDAETITITDSNGLDTEVIADQYVKGGTGALVDTAFDQQLRAIIEGGVYDSTNTFYTAPTSESTKKYFAIEVVRPMYSKGTNKAGDLIGYLVERIFTATGNVGDDAGDRNFLAANYNWVATTYKDPVTKALSSWITEQKYTKATFDTLLWDSI